VKIKKMFVIIIILLMAFTSSACNDTKKVIEPVEIHFLVGPPQGLSGPDSTILYDAVENFHKINPLITVILEYWPESMVQNVGEGTIKLLESKESPDIIGLPLPYINSVEIQRLLFDLLQIPGSQEIDINKAILDLATIDGKLLALPYSAYPQAISYNKDLFDEAGISYPQGDWTWEQFRDISKVVNPSQSPLLTYEIGTLALLIGSLEKGLLSPDKTTSIGYLDSPEAVRTIQWLNAYYRDSGQNTPIKDENIFSLFDSHQIGMFLGSMGNEYSNFFKIGVAPLPHFADGKRANPTFISGFMISQNSKHPLEAWEFIKYLTLSKNEDSIKFANRTVATSTLMAEAVGQNSDPVKSIYVDEFSYAINSTDYSFTNAWNGDENLAIQFEKLLTTNDKDIPVKLHELALKFDQALKKANSVSDQQTNSTSP
jgi:multiple sugar transport system substrate-binding protein